MGFLSSLIHTSKTLCKLCELIKKNWNEVFINWIMFTINVKFSTNDLPFYSWVMLIIGIGLKLYSISNSLNMAQMSPLCIMKIIEIKMEIMFHLTNFFPYNSSFQKVVTLKMIKRNGIHKLDAWNCPTNWRS